MELYLVFFLILVIYLILMVCTFSLSRIQISDIVGNYLLYPGTFNGKLKEKLNRQVNLNTKIKKSQNCSNIEKRIWSCSTTETEGSLILFLFLGSGMYQ